MITTRQKHQVRSLSFSISLDTMPIQKTNERKVWGMISDERLDWDPYTHKNSIQKYQVIYIESQN